MNDIVNDTVETRDGLSRAVAELLVQRGKLDPAGFERALRLQSETGERVDLLLTKLGQVSERDLADALSTQLKLPIVEVCDYPSEPILADRLSAKFLQEFRALPLSDGPDGILLAIADPLDSYVIEAIRLLANRPQLHEERSAVIATNVTTPAAADKPACCNTRTNGLCAGSNRFHGYSIIKTASEPT